MMRRKPLIFGEGSSAEVPTEAAQAKANAKAQCTKAKAKVEAKKAAKAKPEPTEAADAESESDPGDTNDAEEDGSSPRGVALLCEAEVDRNMPPEEGPADGMGASDIAAVAADALESNVGGDRSKVDADTLADSADTASVPDAAIVPYDVERQLSPELPPAKRPRTVDPINISGDHSSQPRQSTGGAPDVQPSIAECRRGLTQVRIEEPAEEPAGESDPADRAGDEPTYRADYKPPRHPRPTSLDPDKRASTQTTSCRVC
jgi:hypothetical protein